jgi:nucleoside-diphosphate-sugar epimerase
VGILIAGCGYVGTALGLLLARDGHEVLALRRRPEGLPRGLTPLTADLTDAGSLAGLPRDLDAVFYTAAAGRREADAYRAAYVTGVANLLAALRGVRRFFLVSSTAVWAQTGGEWVDEGSPAQPASFAGRLLLEGEECLRESGLPGSVVRFAGIYGPGRTRLVDRVRSGGARIPPGPPRWSNRIHRDDCAGALRHLMGLAQPAPLYAGADCEPAELRTVYGWLAGRLGVPAPPEGEEETDPGREGNKRVRNARLLAAGYRFRYPTFREGYGALLAASHAAPHGGEASA